MQITNGTVTFMRQVQPAQYESAKAEVSFAFRVDDGEDASQLSAEALKLAKRQALAALGIGTEATTEPAEKADKPKRQTAAQKKAAEKAAAKSDMEAAAEDTPPAAKKTDMDAAADDDMDFLGKSEVAKISDEELQNAAQAAAKKVTGAKVKEFMFEEFDKLTHLGKLPQEKRADFVERVGKLTAD